MKTLTEIPGKRDEILQAAQQRLGIYGYEKTTMLEIANDISMSKAALYYYFSDKQSIFKAVIEKEHKEFVEQINKKMASITDPEIMLSSYIELRFNYFKLFMNLGKFRYSMSKDIKPVLRETFLELRKHEQILLIKILEQGNHLRQFRSINPEQDAKMYLDIIRGLRYGLIQQESFIEVSNDDLKDLEYAVNYFTILFINGLKYNLSK